MLRQTLPLLLLCTAAPTLAQDPPVTRERTGMRNERYCELLVVTRHGLSGTAIVYNTIGLNTCPDDQWKSLNPDQLKKESNAFVVMRNGPRHFMMDRNALQDHGNVGPPKLFDGLAFRALAQLEVHPGQGQHPYKENAVDRQTRYIYEAGKKVYELLSPDAHAYIMQSYSLEVDPSLTEASLDELNSRLKLPKAWQYRARTLAEDLVVTNEGTRAFVIQDDLKNTYQRRR